MVVFYSMYGIKNTKISEKRNKYLKLTSPDRTINFRTSSVKFIIFIDTLCYYFDPVHSHHIIQYFSNLSSRKIAASLQTKQQQNYLIYTLLQILRTLKALMLTGLEGNFLLNLTKSDRTFTI